MNNGKARQSLGNRTRGKITCWRLEVPLEVSDQSSVTSWKQERQGGLKMGNGSLGERCGGLNERGLEGKKKKKKENLTHSTSKESRDV